MCAATKTQVDQRNFNLEGNKVHCGEEVCLVEPPKYKVYEFELSNSAKEVTFDAKLLKLTGIKLGQDELDLGMWMRMEWHDPRLKLCACATLGKELDSEQNVSAGSRKGTEITGNFEEFVWTPDFTISERIHSVRREGSLLDFLLEADGRSSGVNVSYTVNLRVAAKCMYNVHDYPYNKNSCGVRIVPYNHGHETATKFLPRNMTMRNILYKDVDVEVCFLPREDGLAAKNGFKVALDRRGDGVMRSYEYTMMTFVVTSVLSVVLSPRYTDVSFIGEAVLAAFYIYFDLYTKAPPVSVEDGGETLLEQVIKLCHFHSLLLGQHSANFSHMFCVTAPSAKLTLILLFFPRSIRSLSVSQ